jgi:pimeloyl-ACP methyl ester carboxylesterase
MDGTGLLFEDFKAALPASIDPVVISYPVDQQLGYVELESYVERQLPSMGSFVLLGESFSGPVALAIAARGHPRLAAVILVASFARNPWSRAGKWLRPFVGSWCFRFLLPPWIIRRFLAGSDAPAVLIADFQAAVGTVSAAVLSRRAREILTVDLRPALSQIRVPVLLLSAARDRLVPANFRIEFGLLEDRFEHVSIDAPHLILQRRPAEAARVIESFLGRRSSIVFNGTGIPANEAG